MNIKRLLIKLTFFFSFFKIVTSLKIIQLETRHCTVTFYLLFCCHFVMLLIYYNCIYIIYVRVYTNMHTKGKERCSKTV